MSQTHVIEARRRAVLAALAALAATAGPARAEDTLRIGSEGDPRLRTLADAYHSDAVRQFILSAYQGRQLPAW